MTSPIVCEQRVFPSPSEVPECLQPVFRSGAGSRVAVLRMHLPQPLPFVGSAGAPWSPACQPGEPGLFRACDALGWSANMLPAHWQLMNSELESF